MIKSIAPFTSMDCFASREVQPDCIQHGRGHPVVPVFLSMMCVCVCIGYESFSSRLLGISSRDAIASKSTSRCLLHPGQPVVFLPGRLVYKKNPM